MTNQTDSSPAPRTPLTRERVLRAASAFADENGIESLSMRRLGQQLGVEAMSLYNHVANKDEILDGMVEMVVGEFEVPPEGVDWKVAMRQTAKSIHEVLLRHPWASVLIESRVQASPVRFRYGDAVSGTLRRAGFSIELAYRAFLTIESYIHGFTLQEVNCPFDAEERPDVAATLEPQIAVDEYPYLAEMIGLMMQKGAAGYESEFEFGVNLILDGLERARDMTRQNGEV